MFCIHSEIQIMQHTNYSELISTTFTNSSGPTFYADKNYSYTTIKNNLRNSFGLNYSGTDIGNYKITNSANKIERIYCIGKITPITTRIKYLT
jgi:hypothetical protein